MKIREIKDILEANLLAGEEHLGFDVDFGYGCDLMSDVLAYVQNNVVLLTGLVHHQVIKTAEMLDIKCVVIVRGKLPEEEIVELARSRDIVLMTTKHSLFTACSLLAQRGLPGEEIAHHEIGV